MGHIDCPATNPATPSARAARETVPDHTLRIPGHLREDVRVETHAPIEREALRLNDRYVQELLEEHAFCPFAREGRLAGETHREVHVPSFDDADVDRLVRIMTQMANDRSVSVVQVIFPMLEVDHEAFSAFARELTEVGHRALSGETSAVGADERSEAVSVFACAPLHPRLPFSEETPYTLIPLFRRAPDPTIQWVRLSALEELYADRPRDVYLDPADIAEFVQNPPRKPLYDQVAEANAWRAEKMDIDRIAMWLAELELEGLVRYQAIAAGEIPPAPFASLRVGRRQGSRI